ncbi:hypothetical protein KIH07_18580 [Hydrogenophaga taeniospiralis]|uniref:hypothetical protein n=1 Tax=Hydrogenophaga taeniospiralis TaxID=65656 RepID=UPI001CF9C893|nr:hypothetical protein [Hydrogenophaga taeniospiralis]MCB4365747.1 hypothetical protein [Hydrogenophaga taeniospiralis]
MPRQSAASLSVATPSLGARPPPPRELSDRQKALWLQYTACKPVGWFTDESLPLLVALVAHVEGFEVLEREFRAVTDLADIDKLKWYDQLAKLRQRESAAIASLSTKLRLTPQSRYTPQSAATASQRRPGSAPWETKGTTRRTG